jgi:hypothetical protein
MPPPLTSIKVLFMSTRVFTIFTQLASLAQFASWSANRGQHHPNSYLSYILCKHVKSPANPNVCTFLSLSNNRQSFSSHCRYFCVTLRELVFIATFSRLVIIVRTMSPSLWSLWYHKHLPIVICRLWTRQDEQTETDSPMTVRTDPSLLRWFIFPSFANFIVKKAFSSTRSICTSKATEWS